MSRRAVTPSPKQINCASPTTPATTARTPAPSSAGRSRCGTCAPQALAGARRARAKASATSSTSLKSRIWSPWVSAADSPRESLCDEIRKQAGRLLVPPEDVEEAEVDPVDTRPRLKPRKQLVLLCLVSRVGRARVHDRGLVQAQPGREHPGAAGVEIARRLRVRQAQRTPTRVERGRSPRLRRLLRRVPC